MKASPMAEAEIRAISLQIVKSLGCEGVVKSGRVIDGYRQSIARNDHFVFEDDWNEHQGALHRGDYRFTNDANTSKTDARAMRPAASVFVDAPHFRPNSFSTSDSDIFTQVGRP